MTIIRKMASRCLSFLKSFRSLGRQPTEAPPSDRPGSNRCAHAPSSRSRGLRRRLKAQPEPAHSNPKAHSALLSKCWHQDRLRARLKRPLNLRLRLNGRPARLVARACPTGFDIGVLGVGRWSVEVLACWRIGVLACWGVGVLERWGVGALGC